MRLILADFATDPDTLAQQLIGCSLCRRFDDGEVVSGVIVETEAYCGVEDKAAHSVGWRRTERTEPMFGPPGTSYVFLTYGMHHLFNVVCGEVGEPVAVLIRAVRIERGIDRARSERRSKSRSARAIADHDLGSGPAKLCQAMGIDRSLNAVDLAEHPSIWIDGRTQEFLRIDTGPRIGVAYAQEWAQRALRWWVVGSREVSLGDGMRSVRRLKASGNQG